MKAEEWVDREAYPFEGKYLKVEGGRIHYVDVGVGPTILMVHGTPTWSFLYRHLIRDLSRDHRVVAVDHLGFGLSDKPEDWSYRPVDHKRNLEIIIERLELKDLTLVVHDFGGPIAIGYAVEHPANVRALVILNTWMWSLKGTPAEKLSNFMSGTFGRFLYKRLNLSPRVLLKAAFGDKRKLTREIHRQYIDAFPRAADRQGPWVLAKELIGSSRWYEEQWSRLDRIRDKPVLLLWGMQDPAFGPDALERWKGALRTATVIELEEVGHFVPEEAPDRAAQEIRSFIS